MNTHMQYLWYVLRHKWFVLVAGLRYRVPLWQLLIHDLSKFSPAEWFAYVDYFYGNLPTSDEAWKRGYTGRTKEEAKSAFDFAWNHHQKANPHHWQYWLLTPDKPSTDWVISSLDGGMRLAGIANYRLFPERNVAEMTALHDQGMNDAAYLAALLNRQPVALPMPERYVREMVADWAGAGRAITGRWEVQTWYRKTKQVIILHPDTQALVEAVLQEVQHEAS